MPFSTSIHLSYYYEGLFEFEPEQTASLDEDVDAQSGLVVTSGICAVEAQSLCQIITLTIVSTMARSLQERGSTRMITILSLQRTKHRGCRTALYICDKSRSQTGSINNDSFSPIGHKKRIQCWYCSFFQQLRHGIYTYVR